MSFTQRHCKHSLITRTRRLWAMNTRRTRTRVTAKTTVSYIDHHSDGSDEESLPKLSQPSKRQKRETETPDKQSENGNISEPNKNQKRKVAKSEESPCANAAETLPKKARKPRVPQPIFCSRTCRIDTINMHLQDRIFSICTP